MLCQFGVGIWGLGGSPGHCDFKPCGRFDPHPTHHMALIDQIVIITKALNITSRAWRMAEINHHRAGAERAREAV